MRSLEVSGGKTETIPVATLSAPEFTPALINVGSGESRFNVSLIARDRVTRQCPKKISSLKRKVERKRN